jgi:Skp family chaperone for outer membrane proteins
MTKSKVSKSLYAQPSDRVVGLRALMILVAALFGAAPLFAQQQTTAPTDRSAVISSPILTIDSDRVFQESEFGVRVAQEIEEEGAKLAAENDQIADDLEAEEQDLTDRRAGLTPEEFRVLADAFDKKVQRTRQEQAAKGRALNELLDQERDVFLTAAGPVLERLMRDAGAAVILDRRTVFVSASAVEITDAAIALLNETLGSGEMPR